MYDELVKRLREADQLARRWISVEERLPKINTDVLVCNEDYGKSLLGFAICAQWDGAEWMETWNNKDAVHYVTHWMPLPAPPEVEK